MIISLDIFLNKSAYKILLFRTVHLRLDEGNLIDVWGGLTVLLVIARSIFLLNTFSYIFEYRCNSGYRVL